MRNHRSPARSTDEIIATLAQRQYGVVSRPQLLRAGVSAKVIDGRLARGQLRALHRGVFQMGPISVPRARDGGAPRLRG